MQLLFYGAASTFVHSRPMACCTLPKYRPGNRRAEVLSPSSRVFPEVLVRADETGEEILVGLAVVAELVHPKRDLAGGGAAAQVLLVVRLDGDALALRTGRE